MNQTGYPKYYELAAQLTIKVNKQFIMNNKALKDQYQNMIDWNTYRIDQSKESLNKLIELLPKLGTGEEGDITHQEEIVDLNSLKLIYETGIRNMEGKVDKYKKLLEEMD